MLAADKEAFAADIKKQAIAIRKQELELFVSRYANLTALAIIAMGFAFDGMVELELLEEDEDDNGYKNRLQQGFYMCATLAFAFALYVVVCGSFTVVFGHRLALQGNTGHSLDRAVAVLSKQYWRFLAAGAGALFSMLGATVCIVWIKMDESTAIAASIVLGACLAFIFVGLYSAHNELGIRPPAPDGRQQDSSATQDALHACRDGGAVHGDVHVMEGGAEIDFARMVPTEDGGIEMEEPSVYVSGGHDHPHPSFFDAMFYKRTG